MHKQHPRIICSGFKRLAYCAIRFHTETGLRYRIGSAGGKLAQSSTEQGIDLGICRRLSGERGKRIDHTLRMAVSHVTRLALKEGVCNREMSQGQVILSPDLQLRLGCHLFNIDDDPLHRFDIIPDIGLCNCIAIMREMYSIHDSSAMCRIALPVLHDKRKPRATDMRAIQNMAGRPPIKADSQAAAVARRIADAPISSEKKTSLKLE